MNDKPDPWFIGRRPDGSDYFSRFFFSLTKDEQLEYLKYLESTSQRNGANAALVVVAIIAMFALVIFGHFAGWYPNNY